MYSFVLVLVFGLVGSVLTSRCPVGWTSYHGSCYFYGTEKIDWLRLRKKCQDLNADLVAIETEQENDFLKLFAKENKASRVWTGGNDLYCDGEYTWVSTGDKILFFNWQYDEEHENTKFEEDCIILRSSREYQWTDDACYLSRTYICEAQ